MQGERRPAQLFSTLPTGETQLSLLPSPIPRGILVEEEKARFAAAQQMGGIQPTRQLTEQAEVRGLAESSLTVQPNSTNAELLNANTQLMDAVRILSDEMQNLKQQMRVISPPQADSEELPQYTAGSR